MRPSGACLRVTGEDDDATCVLLPEWCESDTVPVRCSFYRQPRNWLGPPSHCPTIAANRAKSATCSLVRHVKRCVSNVFRLVQVTRTEGGASRRLPQTFRTLLYDCCDLWKIGVSSVSRSHNFIVFHQHRSSSRTPVFSGFYPTFDRVVRTRDTCVRKRRRISQIRAKSLFHLHESRVYSTQIRLARWGEMHRCRLALWLRPAGPLSPSRAIHSSGPLEDCNEEFRNVPRHVRCNHRGGCRFRCRCRA